MASGTVAGCSCRTAALQLCVLCVRPETLGLSGVPALGQCACVLARCYHPRLAPWRFYLISPGKHGHAKANITALDIFTNNKYMDICPTSHNMEAPFVTTNNFSLVDIDEEEFCCLMDEEGNTREDLQFPEGDEYEALRKAFEDGSEVIVTVQAALDTEKIMPTFKIGKA